MKKLIITASLLLSMNTFGATLTPIQLLNPIGSSVGQSIVSTGVSTAPTWSTITLTNGVSGVLPVVNGGLGIGTLTGLALGNGTSAITAYTGTSCISQFTRSISSLGVATCASVANTDLTNSSVTIGSTNVSLGGTTTTVSGLTLVSANLTGTPTAPTATTGTNTTQIATTAFVAAATSQNLPNLTGTTGSIGGSALVAGSCATGTVAITNSTTTMVSIVSPNTYPGAGFTKEAYVSSNGTITVSVCAIIAGTPTAGTYNVRVIQ